MNRFRHLWTTIVTALLALCTTLGLITTTATTATAAPATTPSRTTTATPPQLTQAPLPAWSRALPPTMRQRITAEAHGSSPSARHLTNPDPDTVDLAPGDDSPDADELLQR